MIRTRLFLLLLWLVSSSGRAAPMLYLHNGPESPHDHRYDFHWEVLRTALELTKGTYGPYELRSAVFMSESRQTNELLRASGRITIMFLGTSPEMEEQLIPIRIPVDRDLSGYFVFMIHKDLQPRLSQVKTLADLKRFSMGMAADWLDNSVYKHNGFRVINGNNYDGLFTMVAKKRFDVFPRSAVEILDEYQKRAPNTPGLAIERDLLIHYRWPMYFWFSKTPEGAKLAKRAQEGMNRMLDDGSYAKLFDRYFAPDITQLQLRQRRLFEIENPLLPKATPVQDKRIWFQL